MRCDPMYRKIQKLRELGEEEVDSFCKKHPDTGRRIEVYLDQIIPLIDELTAESEILLEENPPLGGIVSEKASRPLFSEKDPEVKKEAMQQIVTLAEEKAMDGKKPQVTEREVKEILSEIKGTPACPVCQMDEEEEEPEPEPVKPPSNPVE